MLPNELLQLRAISQKLFQGVVTDASRDYFFRLAKDLDNLIYSISFNSKLFTK